MSPFDVFASCIAGTPADECNDTGSVILAGDGAWVGIAIVVAVAIILVVTVRLLRRKQ